jgi:hypothetical protein
MALHYLLSKCEEDLIIFILSLTPPPHFSLYLHIVVITKDRVHLGHLLSTLNSTKLEIHTYLYIKCSKFSFNLAESILHVNYNGQPVDADCGNERARSPYVCMYTPGTGWSSPKSKSKVML